MSSVCITNYKVQLRCYLLNQVIVEFFKWKCISTDL